MHTPILNGKFGIVISLCLLASCKDNPGTVATQTDSPLSAQIKLESLPASITGVDFNNKINDEGRVNIFTWHFIYNGAGVAAGDINNDGLPDLYFTGNMVPDKLYLNKGDFVFEDITSNSGIGNQIWSSGVTMADVNADGLLDIYVCKNSPTGIRDNNRNKLYINSGKNSFRESAAEYGIDDVGFGVQATFFDADQDGDLDMFLVNQPFDEFSKLVNKPEIVAAYPVTDRFFFFDKGRFTDRTEEMGMMDDRYGLNVSLGDFDLNGWTDMYICNDYHHADRYYLNYGGKFTDATQSHTGHISFYSMGSDVADINQDGWLDLFTLDMAFEDHYRSKTNMGSMNRDRFWQLVADGQHYQYMQNGLQLNVGQGYFSEVAQVAGIHKSDWSYSTLFADLDHDSDQDIIITNGILRDLRNNDFNVFVKEKYQNRVGPDNYLEVLKNIPTTPIKNVIFRNDGNMSFSKLPAEDGFETAGFSHGMACVDLNRDGMLDVVINNSNAPASIYRNVSATNGHYINIKLEGPGSNLAGLGCSVILYSNGKKQINTMQTTRGYFSSSEPVLHFGLGAATTLDSLKVYWNHSSMSVLKNIPVDRELHIKYNKEKKIPYYPDPENTIVVSSHGIIQHQHAESIFDDYQLQVLLPYKQSQNGPHISVADIDSDGKEDFFIGGPAGYPGSIYQQSTDGNFTLLTQPAFSADKECEDQESVFLDAEGDGDLDLIVVAGSNELSEGSSALRSRLYINDGSGHFSLAPHGVFPDIRINSQALVVCDIDGDKDQDVVIGGRLIGGKYPLPAASIILINDRGKFIDKTSSLAEFLNKFGLITDILADDMEKDGDIDLLVTGEWMKPSWLINNGNSGFSMQTIDIAGTGLWWTVESGDFDQDGDNDYLLGNLGWNNKFGGSHGTKLEVYANDFDKNGDFDVVLATTKGEELLPVRGRECSSEEMPFILDKFPNYESYAKAELDEILSEEQLQSGTHEKLSTMSSILLVNDGGGDFIVRELPHICQFGPVKAFQTGDFNRDGKPDFIYAGNHFPTEVETARYDALYPGICFGDGKGNFDCKSLSINGELHIDDIRDIEILQTGKGDVVLMSNNNGPLRAYSIEDGK